MKDAVGDGAPPVIPNLDVHLVKPDIMPAPLQVGFDEANQFLVRIVSVAKEDAKSYERV